MDVPSKSPLILIELIDACDKLLLVSEKEKCKNVIKIEDEEFLQAIENVINKLSHISILKDELEYRANFVKENCGFETRCHKAKTRIIEIFSQRTIQDKEHKIYFTELLQFKEPSFWKLDQEYDTCRGLQEYISRLQDNKTLITAWEEWHHELLRIKNEADRIKVDGCFLLLEIDNALQSGNFDEIGSVKNFIQGFGGLNVNCIKVRDGACLEEADRSCINSSKSESSGINTRAADRETEDEGTEPVNIEVINETTGKISQVMEIDEWEELGIGFDENGCWAFSPRPDIGGSVILKNGTEINIPGNRWVPLLKLLAGSNYGNTARKSDYITACGKVLAIPGEDDGATRRYSEEESSEAKNLLAWVSGTTRDLTRLLRKQIACQDPLGAKPPISANSDEFIETRFVVQPLFRESRKIKFGRKE